jgi:hypothetical protein
MAPSAMIAPNFGWWSACEELGEAIDALDQVVVAEGEREPAVATQSERLARHEATFALSSTRSASSSVVVAVTPSIGRFSSPVRSG